MSFWYSGISLSRFPSSKLTYGRGGANSFGGFSEGDVLQLNEEQLASKGWFPVVGLLQEICFGEPDAEPESDPPESFRETGGFFL